MAQDTAVDVKHAVAIAREYLTDLFPTHGNVELEEVEPISGGAGWKVTFSYDREGDDPLRIRQFLPPETIGKRVYKVVTIDASGNPQAVKMR